MVHNDDYETTSRRPNIKEEIYQTSKEVCFTFAQKPMNRNDELLEFKSTDSVFLRHFNTNDLGYTLSNVITHEDTRANALIFSRPICLNTNWVIDLCYLWHRSICLQKETRV